MPKKRRNRQKERHRPPKARYTLVAHAFQQQRLAPLRKRYEQLMSNQLYDEAIETFGKLEAAQQEYRRLLHSKKKDVHK
jgi:hypothetical protein